ncbi:MAG: hypothetical protein IJV05_03160 [Muribaculaceae bacterium]|nr:hypothetical protein [Muribaculaceae bacterium]
MIQLLCVCRSEWPSFEARPIGVLSPQATLTFGQCALGFAQFKAAGLGEVFRPHACPH